MDSGSPLFPLPHFPPPLPPFPPRLFKELFARERMQLLDVYTPAKATHDWRTFRKWKWHNMVVSKTGRNESKRNRFTLIISRMLQFIMSVRSLSHVAFCLICHHPNIFWLLILCRLSEEWRKHVTSPTTRSRRGGMSVNIRDFRHDSRVTWYICNRKWEWFRSK